MAERRRARAGAGRTATRVALAVVAVSALASACGDDDDGGEISAGEAVGTTSVAPEVVDGSDGSDGAVSDDAVSDHASTDTMSDVAASEITTFPPPAPPVPYEVEAVNCSAWAPDTAEAGICDSFSRWVRADTPDADRVQMMEGGEARADTIIDGFTEFRSSIEYATVRVERITVLTDALAEVEFDVRWMDGPSPYFPTTILGYAVFEAPRWRVSAFTTCAMALAFGTDCSGLEPPVPPTGEEPLG